MGTGNEARKGKERVNERQCNLHTRMSQSSSSQITCYNRLFWGRKHLAREVTLLVISILNWPLAQSRVHIKREKKSNKQQDEWIGHCLYITPRLHSQESGRTDTNTHSQCVGTFQLVLQGHSRQSRGHLEPVGDAAKRAIDLGATVFFLFCCRSIRWTSNEIACEAWSWWETARLVWNGQLPHTRLSIAILIWESHAGARVVGWWPTDSESDFRLVPDESHLSACTSTLSDSWRSNEQHNWPKVTVTCDHSSPNCQTDVKCARMQGPKGSKENTRAIDAATRPTFI